MYPNQQYPRPGGGSGAPYPQQQPFGNNPQYGIASGLTG